MGVMKGYFPKAPELEPCHQMQFFLGGGLTPLQKCSRHILHPQSTGLDAMVSNRCKRPMLVSSILTGFLTILNAY